MVETTPPDPSASPPTPPAPAAAPGDGAPPAELSVRALLEAGVHFGHQTRRWNPRMKPFIFGERNGIHILDLDHTLERFRDALDFLRETVASGGKVLFVGTKRQAAAPIQLEAERSGQYYVNNRWLGGMLTNFRTVKKSIERYKQLLALLEDEEKSAELSKKERSSVVREIERYSKALVGIKEMGRLPDALFVVDVNREHIAVSEARRLGIPIVAVVDTNCDPLGIEFVVPGNDDAIRAIQLYCARAADACAEGAELHNERLQSQAASAEAEAAAAPAPSTGRVVVEIKQPARRGRGAGASGARSAGGRRAPEREPAQAPAAAEPAKAPAESTKDNETAPPPGAEG